MKFLDDLVALLTRRRPKTRPASRETIDRVPIMVRVFTPGRRDPVAVVQANALHVQDYAEPVIADGKLVRDEREAGVFIDCILPAVHVDRNHVEVPQAEPLRTAGRQAPPPPGATVEALAGV